MTSHAIKPVSSNRPGDFAEPAFALLLTDHRHHQTLIPSAPKHEGFPRLINILSSGRG